MARRFRFYGKKRGDRRTGSKRLGSYGEALFFSVFLLLGIGGLYLLVDQLILPQIETNRRYVKHECIVLDTRIAEKQQQGRTLYRPEVRIRYEVNGTQYEPWTYDAHHEVYSYSQQEAEEILGRLDIGDRYVCWYNPDRPNSAVLVLRYIWWTWLLLILPGSITIFGLWGVGRALLQSGTSAERRAALARKAADLAPFEEQRLEHGYPHIPSLENITESPGTRLAYRLPLDAAQGWKLAGYLLMCLMWNGIVGWFVVVNIQDHRAGQGSWLLSLWLLPFVGFGMAILYYTARLMMLTTGVGATRLEISANPLLPGNKYEVFLQQSGHLNVNSLRLSLVCIEEATYRQGTDTRIESRTVFEQTFYDRKSFLIEPGMPFEDICEIQVPAGGMHSFHSNHNEIKWLLVVQGDIARWPDYQRRFPIIVYPPTSDQENL